MKFLQQNQALDTKYSEGLHSSGPNLIDELWSAQLQFSKDTCDGYV